MAGIPLYWMASPPPFLAAMAFRVGRADETLVTGGITHLVEHLAIHALGPIAVAHNAFVDSIHTVFHASGTQDGVLRFLENIARTLRALPVGRLEDERRVLMTEASRRGRSWFTRLLASRFGPRGFGLGDYLEFGLGASSAEDVTAWCAERFTRQNCAIFMTGPPPEGFGLDLPEGRRFEQPASEPIAGLTLPAIRQTDDSSVCVGYVAPRTSASKFASDLAEMVVGGRLRRDAGLSYTIGFDWLYTTAETAHVTIGADCLREHADAVVSIMHETLNDLRTIGPPEDTVRHYFDQWEEAREHPDSIPSYLDSQITNELMGAPFKGRHEIMERLRLVTPEEAAAALDEALTTAILITPEGTRPPDGYHPYSSGDERKISGTVYAWWPTHAARAPGQPPHVCDRIIVSEEAIADAREPGRGRTVIIPFEDCHGVILDDDGSMVFIGPEDEGWIEVAVPELLDGDGFVEHIRRKLPESLFVFHPNGGTRWTRIEALAVRSLGRSSLWLDLERLPRRLEPGEEVEALAAATKDDVEGLLALTDRRLIWVRHGRGARDGFAAVERGEGTTTTVRRGITPRGVKVTLTFTDGEGRSLAVRHVRPAELVADLIARVGGTGAARETTAVEEREVAGPPPDQADAPE